MDVLRVSSKSNPNSVAGALAGVLRHRGSAEIQVVGAGALNQAVKAVVITRGFLAPTGQDLACRPAFADISIDGQNRTAIRLRVDISPPPGDRPDSPDPPDEPATPLAGTPAPPAEPRPAVPVEPLPCAPG
ncbi:MAG: stage V sporulation protein S [Acidobacteriota bacterium]|nr:stage V sporulation protein S [Acidobacteriota bacterium]